MLLVLKPTAWSLCLNPQPSLRDALHAQHDRADAAVFEKHLAWADEFADAADADFAFEFDFAVCGDRNLAIELRTEASDRASGLGRTDHAQILRRRIRNPEPHIVFANRQRAEVAIRFVNCQRLPKRRLLDMRDVQIPRNR